MEKKVKRTNTYLNKEYFKVISLAYTKEKTFAFSQYLANHDKPIRGVFNAPFLKTQIIIFPRFVSKLDHQATTVAVEAIVIYLENREEFSEIKAILHRYGQVAIRVICATQDFSDLAQSIGAKFILKPDDSKELKEYINQLDMEEYKKIKGEFEKYDTDGGGSIDNNEMTQIAVSMGFNADDEEFKKGVYALDLNQDGQISLNEFITWWKIGRQNTEALPKIYDLFQGANTLIKNLFNLQDFTVDVTKLQEENVRSISTQKLLFRSPGIYKLKTFVEGSIAIGPQKRQEKAVEFLSQFTKNTGSAKANWLSILVPLNSKQRKLNIEKAKELLDDFKENCLKWGEQHMGGAFISFFKNLIVYETNANENSVILALRLKIDIEDLVKSALQQIIFILGHLQPDKESTWINFKCHSNLDLYETVTKDVTISDFFEVSELIVEGSTFKEHLKSMYMSLNAELRESYSWIQFFFQPNNVNIELDCKLEDIFGDGKDSWTNFSLKKVGLFLDFLKSNLSKELLASADNMEICLNLYDIFANLKIYTNSTFSENVNVEKNL